MTLHAARLWHKLGRVWLILVRRLAGTALALEILLLGIVVSAAAHETITYGYDACGRVVQVAHSCDTNNGVISAATFDRTDNRTTYAVSCPTSAVIADAFFETSVQSAGGYTYSPRSQWCDLQRRGGISANNSP